MSSDMDEYSLSEKSYMDESEDATSSEESDYDPESGADLKNVHQVITDERRKQLISLINDQGYTIAKASRKVGLMYSTAKTIYARYKKELASNSNGRGAQEESNNKSQNVKPARTQRETRKVSKAEETYRPESSKKSAKIEENERMQAPNTRKRVKPGSDQTKESTVCKIKELSNSETKTLSADSLLINTKIENNLKSEAKNETPLIHKVKLEPEKGAVNPVMEVDLKHKMESMLENYDRQRLLGQLALSKMMSAGPLMNMSCQTFGQGLLPNPSLENLNNMLIMNYLWRQSYLQPNLTQLP